MGKGSILYKPGRHPSESYEDILDSDMVSSPDFYREGDNPSAALESYDTSRYYDKSFFQKEVDYVWPRIWQWAAREEEIPLIGDHVVFDVAGYSFLIVRSSASEIKAFYNSCLHRGRQLVECDGS